MKHFGRIVVTAGLAAALALSAALAGCSSRTPYSEAYSAAPVSPPASSSAAAYSMNDMSSYGKAANQTLLLEEAGDKGFTGTILSPSDGGGNDLAASTTSTAPAEPTQPRKLIRDSNLQLESKEFDTALQSLQELIQKAGGYMESQSVNGMSLRGNYNYYERSANLTARVPADRLDEVTADIGKLCNILSQSDSVQDISDNYYDAQSRLEVLRVKETRLTELLAKAEKLEDIIQLEDALSNCQYEIDSLTGQLKRMDSQVSYSTLYIRLDEVVEYSDTQPTPKTFGERLGDALGRSWRNLKSSVQGTLLWLIEAGPVTVFYLALWGGAIYLVYRLFFRKRMAAKRAAKQAAAPAPVTPPPPPAPPADDTEA